MNELKTKLLGQYESGDTFNANDALAALVPGSTTINAGNIAQLLQELTDEGKIRRVNEQATGPHEFQVV